MDSGLNVSPKVCLSVTLFRYKITCLRFSDKRFGIDSQLVTQGRYLCQSLYFVLWAWCMAARLTAVISHNSRNKPWHKDDVRLAPSPQMRKPRVRVAQVTPWKVAGPGLLPRSA